jgi:glutathione S-transferase
MQRLCADTPRILPRVSASTPTLYVFAISHYCEKARWALDFLGIEHQLRFVAPGEHGQIAKQLGAPRSSVPYLQLGDNVIQGSADIMSWADSTPAATGHRLTPDTDIELALEIEQRIDSVAGVHVRRFYCSEAMVEHAATVRPIFIADLPLMQKLKISLGWSKIRKIMITRMDLGQEQGLESRRIVEGELDWLDDLLSDGREYLVGERFSRADIAVASLLSPLALPSEHPTYSGLTHPPKLAATIVEWGERASLQWVRDIYRKHR